MDKGRLDKGMVYDLLATFHVAGIGLMSCELCKAAEEVLEEPLSPDVLEERIETLRRMVPQEERERWVKLLRKIKLLWQELNSF